jgi:hypothetical protein
MGLANSRLDPGTELTDLASSQLAGTTGQLSCDDRMMAACPNVIMVGVGTMTLE